MQLQPPLGFGWRDGASRGRSAALEDRHTRNPTTLDDCNRLAHDTRATDESVHALAERNHADKVEHADRFRVTQKLLTHHCAEVECDAEVK